MTNMSEPQDLRQPGSADSPKGAWEGSADGSQWKHDFELNYIKVD